jgi:hypothetical protein
VSDGSSAQPKLLVKKIKDIERIILNLASIDLTS